MNSYEFTLRFTIADVGADTDALIEKLYEAGCEDALIGFGQPGRLALQFTREASSAELAMRSASRTCRVLRHRPSWQKPGLISWGFRTLPTCWGARASTCAS